MLFFPLFLFLSRTDLSLAGTFSFGEGEAWEAWEATGEGEESEVDEAAGEVVETSGEVVEEEASSTTVTFNVSAVVEATTPGEGETGVVDLFNLPVRLSGSTGEQWEEAEAEAKAIKGTGSIWEVGLGEGLLFARCGDTHHPVE